MKNFKKLDTQQKIYYHKIVQETMDVLGGANLFLELLESIKGKKLASLSERSSRVETQRLILTWNKIIFPEKVERLRKFIQENADEGKYSLGKENAEKKKTINMIKTLLPIEFNLRANEKDAQGITFKLFNSFRETQEVELNHLFLLLFNTDVAFCKQAMKFKQN